MKRLLIIFLFLLSISFYGQKSQPKNDSCLKVPEALGPANGTRLYVSSICDIKSFSFMVFNRWGELIYSTDEYTTPLGLDVSEKIEKRGKLKNKYHQGVYMWLASYKIIVNDKLIDKHSKGVLTIFN